ncbi:MAG: hypothetical protein JWO30_3500 [Fibrobacteres bacterium]|nr:hypothetical protein [Fibrobacterota bacterium]
MENRMISRFKSFVLPVTLAAVMTAFVGCAGSKHSSSSSMDSSMGSAEPDKNQKLEDARRSAEDAEAKAHQLREEKNSSTAKSGK